MVKSPYITDDLQEAIERGRIMGAARKAKQPPLGPTGSSANRKAAHASAQSTRRCTAQ